MSKWMSWLALACLAAVAQAATNTDEEVTADQARAAFLAGIQYKTGEVTVGDGLAKLTLPPSFRYVGPADSEKILLMWGNPPEKNKPLGMLFPSDATPDSAGSWAVVIEYQKSGYVKDDDADKIDYAKMLKEMQSAAREESKARVKQGYGTIEIVGWASPPRYDKVNHKMYWAKELKFGGETENTLNYGIRILGRRGVLVLNAVSGISQLRDIEAATPEILAMVDFKEGHRYVDFNPSSDKYAAYGLAALVAGGVAAKAGLFKGLIVALIAAKKFIIIGLIALVAWVKKLMGRNKAEAKPPAGPR